MATAEVHEFFEILRTGSRQEVEKLLLRLDPSLRRIIRLRLVDGRLRRLMDTSDIFQSLVKDFLSQKRDNDSPEHAAGRLSAYLAAAVHHKIKTRARKDRRNAGSLPDGADLTCREHSAVKRIEDRDYIAAVRCRLSDDTLRLLDLSAEGLTWSEISKQVGGAPDMLRMRLRRGIAKAISELEENSGHAR